jgi:hypothetical protein
MNLSSDRGGKNSAKRTVTGQNLLLSEEGEYLARARGHADRRSHLASSNLPSYPDLV